MKKIEEALVPVQEVGEDTETFEVLQAQDVKQALMFFIMGVQQLKDVNQWSELCGFLSSGFQLIDEFGSVVNGCAEVGLYIRIDIPGPGPVNGQGYDWAIIEDISNVSYGEDEEAFFIQARPSAHPLYKEDGVAHFLKKEATSTFMISRKDDAVRVTVYGRNEVPNTDISNLRDKVRNSIIGSSGAVGLSKLQWKALVKGIVENIKAAKKRT